MRGRRRDSSKDLVFQERSQAWQRTRERRLASMAKRAKPDTEECTFQPRINSERHQRKAPPPRGNEKFVKRLAEARYLRALCVLCMV